MDPRGRPPLAKRWIARARSTLRGVLRRSAVEAEMDEEFRHHIELRTEDLVRRGLPPREARRRAHVEFGHVERHKDAGRAARGLRLLDQARFSWIDVKLGLRMLVRRPGLTIVAAFSLAVGIPVGLAPAHLARALEAPVPEDPSDRVRAVRFWDAAAARARLPEFRDYEGWRDLDSFSEMAALRSSSYALASEDVRATPVSGAETTASLFAMLEVRASMGRTLEPHDELPGAPEVVLLSHDVWRSRLGADPDIVGRTVRLSNVPHTVVGVMPEGFHFPSRQQVWVPMAHAAGDTTADRESVWVLGRLAEGATRDAAQAELDARPVPPDPERPEDRARLQAEAVPIGLMTVNLPRDGVAAVPGFYVMQLVALVLLLIACSNVAMLVFAHTATRFRELSVRNALGASRARIVSQVFVEALVLSVFAAGLGLLLVDRALAWARPLAVAAGLPLPYWLTLGVTPEAVGRALFLAVVCATVAGIIPAVRITGSTIEHNLRRSDADRSGIRFGGVTGALIVADVAISVIVLAFAAAVTDQIRDRAHVDRLVGIPAEEYLAAEVRLPTSELRPLEAGLDPARAVARLADTQERLVARLRAEPRVRSVAVANALPRQDQLSRMVEIEGVDPPPNRPGWWVRTVAADVDYFRALDRPVSVGRDFVPADLDSDARPVIVNTALAERLLGGRNPVGLRLRLVGPGQTDTLPWLEIVGVVGHLGMNMIDPGGDPGIYLPTPPGAVHPLRLALHVGTTPETFAPRLREIVAEVDPTAVLPDPVALDHVYQGDWYLTNAVMAGFALLVVILVSLAASGLYAIVSFSVSERRREIGIRRALGASRLSLVATIMRRPVLQVTVGALLGLPLAMRVLYEIGGAGGRSAGMSMLEGVAIAGGLVLIIGLLSCAAPTARMLRIRPGAALRVEG